MDDNGTSVCINNAVDCAAGMMETALKTLDGIMGDSSQTGAARVSACKVLLDFSLKLDAYSKGLERQGTELDKLDAYLAGFSELY